MSRSVLVEWRGSRAAVEMLALWDREPVKDFEQGIRADLHVK